MKSRILSVGITALPSPTSAWARADALLPALAQVGSADVLAPRETGAHVDQLAGLRLYRVPLPAAALPERLAAFDRAVARQLESESYDLLHLRDLGATTAVVAYARERKVPLVVEVPGLPSRDLRVLDPSLPAGFLAAQAERERACLAAASKVIVGTEEAVRTLELGARGLALPPPVDLARFRPVDLPGDGPLHVVYAGSLAPWEGLETLLYALRAALQKVEVRLTVRAPPLGRWGHRLEELARSLGLGGRVDLGGPLPHDEVPRLYASAHAAVAPLERSQRNDALACPLSIAEALAAGRPVIAADLPPARAMIEPGVHGLLFPAGREAELSRALIELAENRSLLERLSGAARARAASFRAEDVRRTFAAALQRQLSPTVIVSDELFAEEHSARLRPAAPVLGGATAADARTSEEK